MKSKSLLQQLLLLLILPLLSSCESIFEERCLASKRMDFVYLNENARDETDLYLSRVTDYIFDSDSILYRIDPDIQGAAIRSRAIELPDGDWSVLSFANLSAGSRVSDYTVGKTHMKELFVQVVSRDLLKAEKPEYIGNSDNLYFSALNLKIQKGVPKQPLKGYYTPAHARLTVFVTWADKAGKPDVNKKTAAVLGQVSGGYRFLSETKTDKAYNIPYSVPFPLSEEKQQRVQLYPSDDTFRFDAVSMRFETGKAPHLTLMEGTTPLTKSLDLNRFFDANNIDLSNTRIQNFRLSMRIEENKVVISPIDILAWEVEYL